MAADMIIRFQNQYGYFTCERFINVPIPRAVVVNICFTDSAGSSLQATNLKKELVQSLQTLDNNIKTASPACGQGSIKNLPGCRNLQMEDHEKILIVISDGTTERFPDSSVLEWSHEVLPVYRMGHFKELPSPLNAPQAVFWRQNIKEVVPTIWAAMGLSSNESKIFISYKKTDTSTLAEQLFDLLTHEGFDVFLDRFSIQPTVNFQSRLYQELMDKAMVLVLESDNYLTSRWVQLEIAFAKKYRLGVFAFNLNGAPKEKSIDDEYRMPVQVNERGQLNLPETDVIISRIREEHAKAIFRKRHYLQANITYALAERNLQHFIDRNGFIEIKKPVTQQVYKLWPTSRPPEVADYHFANITNSNHENIIIGPEFIEDQRDTLNNWIATKTNIRFYNESQISEMIQTI